MVLNFGRSNASSSEAATSDIPWARICSILHLDALKTPKKEIDCMLPNCRPSFSGEPEEGSDCDFQGLLARSGPELLEGSWSPLPSRLMQIEVGGIGTSDLQDETIEKHCILHGWKQIACSKQRMEDFSRNRKVGTGLEPAELDSTPCAASSSDRPDSTCLGWVRQVCQSYGF